MYQEKNPAGTGTTIQADKAPNAFTLIELSIVLVIIGLIVGGILTGRDLIKSAGTRAQIAQIEKLQTAVNTFRGKFGALPGDMRPEIGNQFGFNVSADCDGSYGRKNGDGLFESVAGNFSQGWAEPGLFWQDLSDPAAGNIADIPNLHGTGTTMLCNTFGSYTPPNYLPPAKLGGNLYLFVYTNNGLNYYGLANVDMMNGSTGTGSNASGGIAVNAAANIDKKIDDGMPTTGRVMAPVPNYFWATPPALYGNSAAADSTSTCYNSTSNTYSLSSAANGGAGPNCGLSFQFQ